jgi:tRNA threonylcarbamoyladenosine biosynthesis protein TsaE
MTKDFTVVTKSAEETQKLGSDFAQKLHDKDVIALYGELGSGKTQFVKGMCLSLGTKQTVNSPTFIIINEYTSEKYSNIFHFDFYRLKHFSDVESIGFDDYMNSRGIVIIEWPEIVEAALPANTKKIHIAHTGESENYRYIRLENPEN